MKVKDHNKFKLFEYENSNGSIFELGEIVILREIEDNNNPIGVVIQTHEDGDYRTDKFGNCSLSEVRIATLSEIKQYRKELVNDIEILDESDILIGLDRFPEFRNPLKEITDLTLKTISIEGELIESEMPYKSQFLIEELIKRLEDFV